MFAWLFDKFRPKYDLFRPQERFIYRYFDGTKTVAVDPLPVYKRIMAVGPELTVDAKVSRSASKEASKAHDGLISKIRVIFDLKPLSDGGLTEIEACTLLDHFLSYCDALKKNINPPPTSPPGTLPPTPPSPVGNPPTLNGSDSGSIAAEPSTDEPPKSPTARP